MDDKAGGWKRPESVPFPSVWSRFSGTKEINGAVPKFWIQDIPDEEFETVMDVMTNGFLVDEPMCESLKLSSDPESVEDIRDMWRDLLQDRLGLICYMENTGGKPVIVGINCTYAKWKSRKFNEPKGKAMSILMESINVLLNMKDEFEAVKSDKVLQALGLYVLREFRGQGLGYQLLKAREALCKAVGIPATVTIFSPKAAHISAARAGFKDLAVIAFDELERINPRLKYPGIQKRTTLMKNMYKVF